MGLVEGVEMAASRSTAIGEITISVDVETTERVGCATSDVPGNVDLLSS